MLEKLRHFLSGKTLFVVVGLLAIPFVFLGNSTVGSIFTNYGTVNGLEVTQTDIQSASGQIERQYQSIFGDEFTIDQIDTEQFVRLLENQINGQKIIQSAARSNGLEISVDDAKREINILKERYLALFLEDFGNVMEYKKSSQYVTDSLKKTENPRIISP